MVRVISAGHVNWDVTLRVDALPEPDGEARIESQQRSGGGSAANVAAALAGMDVESGLIGSIGTDENGLLVRRELASTGVDLDHLIEVDTGETAVKYLIVAADGEVLVFGNDGVNEDLFPDDIDADYVTAADHLHLTSQRPETAAELGRIAQEAGLSVSFDPGRRLGKRDFSLPLAYSDIVFLNEREAATILDGDLEHPSSELYGRVVVTKHGDKGAAVHTPEASYIHPGFGVESIDTTGAGDAFAAGFLATYLEHGDYERAVEFANACGALASREEGARTAPTRAEVEAFLEGQFGG